MTQPLHWSLTGDDRLSQVLERLDRTLGKVDMTMRKVTGDAQHMGRALGESENQSNKASHGLSRVDKAADGVSEKMGSLVGMLGRFGVQAAAATGIATVAVAAFGVKSAMAMQTSEISFEQMLGSAQKAKAFLSDLAQFAEKTPFELKDLETYGSRLLAVGVNAKDIIPLLKQIGNGTAAVGTGAYGIELAVNALGQMRLASHVGLIDLRQLANAGVPIFDALSTKLHKTTAQILEMVTAGEIKVSDVFGAIETGAGPRLSALNGMMDKQSATLEGKLSNFKDKAQRVLGEAFTPALPVLGKVVDGVSAAIPKVIGTLQKMGGDISKIFKGSKVPGELMSSLRDLGKTILPELKKAWNEIVKSVKDNKDGLEKLGKFVAEVVIPVVGKFLVTGIHNVSEAIQGVIWVLGHVEPVLAFFTKMFIGSLGAVLTAAEISFGWIPGLGPKLKEAKKKFDAWADGVMATLNKIDGTTVDVNIKTHDQGYADYRAGERNPSKRASGGPVWAGEGYTVGEQGREEFFPGVSGRIQSADSIRSGQASMASSSDVLGVIVVRHEYPDGKTTHEKLLVYKRQSGKISLGLG